MNGVVYKITQQIISFLHNIFQMDTLRYRKKKLDSPRIIEKGHI